MIICIAPLTGGYSEASRVFWAALIGQDIDSRYTLSDTTHVIFDTDESLNKRKPTLLVIS